MASTPEAVAYGGNRSPAGASRACPVLKWENQTEALFIRQAAHVRRQPAGAVGRCGVPPLERGVEETVGSDQGEGLPPREGAVAETVNVSNIEA